MTRSRAAILGAKPKISPVVLQPTVSATTSVQHQSDVPPTYSAVVTGDAAARHRVLPVSDNNVPASHPDTSTTELAQPPVQT